LRSTTAKGWRIAGSWWARAFRVWSSAGRRSTVSSVSGSIPSTGNTSIANSTWLAAIPGTNYLAATKSCGTISVYDASNSIIYSANWSSGAWELSIASGQ